MRYLGEWCYLFCYCFFSISFLKNFLAGFVAWKPLVVAFVLGFDKAKIHIANERKMVKGRVHHIVAQSVVILIALKQ